MTTMIRPRTHILLSVLCTALAYLAVGLPLAVLPGWVTADLGFSAATAGLAISVQYVATIISRGLVGPLVDTRGPKLAILSGFACCAASGVVFIVAVSVPTSSSHTALAVLFASRIALGFGESLIGTGAIAWAIGRAGDEHTATVISWNGIATYGAIAAGAPLGVLLRAVVGMSAVGTALLTVGVGGLVLTWPQPATRVTGAERLPFTAVFSRVVPYGVALGLSAVGFGTITSFVALDYAAHDWSGAWIAITAFGCAFVLARVLFIGSIARHGGARVAFAFLAIEAVGLLTIWLAAAPTVAVAGAAMAGFGFALLFPALGLIVVGLVPPQNRGAALGAYAMFTDIALCVTGPAAGIVAGHFGYPPVFMMAGCACLLAAMLVLSLMRAAAQDRAARLPRPGYSRPRQG